MLRVADILLALFGLVICAPALLFLCLLCALKYRSPIFRQERIGRDLKPFILFKFRTMPIDTPSVPTHQLDLKTLTKYSRFLRHYKLDELPQLWNVLKGDMSLVGPRPCLPSQNEIIRLRLFFGLLSIRPGITGFAQIMGVDMSNPRLLTKLDLRMTRKLNCCTYFTYVFLTSFGRGSRDALRDR